MLRRRGIARTPSARSSAAIAATLALLAVGLSACGRDDFKNDPRPAVPAEVTVKMGNGAISVSPKEFGAGLVNLTAANLTDTPATLVINGPVDAQSDEIPAAGTETIKVEMTTGQYEASADGVALKPFQFSVGGPRPSGQNDLLLP
jgi:hypothetical protein